MPITSAYVRQHGHRANKGASPFPADMTGTVPQSPQFSGGNSPDSGPASADAPSTTDVPEFSSPTSPLDGSPGSFDVLVIDGSTDGDMSAQSASGSDAGADGASGSSDVTADFPAVPGDRTGQNVTGNPNE